MQRTGYLLILTTAALVLRLSPAQPPHSNGLVHSDYDVLHRLSTYGLRPHKIDLTMTKVGENPDGTSNNGGFSVSGSPGFGLSSSGGDQFGEQLITNGENAYPLEFKHQAALLINTSIGYFQICGAIQIADYFALTAAHCLPYLTGAANMTFDHFIAVGLHNLTAGLGNPGAQIVKVYDYYIHHNYGEDRPGYPNDIAVLLLEEPVINNTYVQFAKLATKDLGNFAGETCLVSGWGYSENGFPDILQVGYQYIPTPKDCKHFWAISRFAKVTKRHICGYYYPTQVCSGDSGGPLTCGEYVVGIVSWALANCSGCFPGVYTRISFYYKWIVQAMKMLS